MTRRQPQPWWIPAFLGSVPDTLDPRHLSLLGAVVLALLFEEYDVAMLIAALRFIAADLGMAETGGRMILRALSTELFPTSHRSAASGMWGVLETMGSAAGLFLTGAMTRAPGGLAATVVLLSLIVFVGGLVLLFLPETHQRELEEIARN